MPQAKEFRDLGAKLRQARRTKRLRLKDVAEKVGCSESLLSKIEHEKVVPSLRMLHRIAAELDTSIAYLFADPKQDDVQVYRSGKRPAVILNGEDGRPAIRLERLVPYSEEQTIDGNVHVVDPGAGNGGEIKHFGQEVGYVLEGHFELTVGDRTCRLRAGDSFFFRSDLPHSYRNVGNSVARVVWINTPPTF